MSDIVLSFLSGTKNGLNRVGAMTSVKWNPRSRMKKTDISFSYMLSKYLPPQRFVLNIMLQPSSQQSFI